MTAGNPQPPNESDKLTTKNIQYPGAEAATVVLPAVLNHHYEIHNVSVNTNSTTDVDVTSGAKQVFYLNAPAAASAASGESTNMHLDTPDNQDIIIDCGAGTFLSITYHLRES